MPEEPVNPMTLLLAPPQMLMQGLNTTLSQLQSMGQSVMNTAAMNMQDVSQTIQRGQAQFVSGLNQGIAGVDGVFKKPLVDLSQISQGGQRPAAPQSAAPTTPQYGTVFSPPPAGGSEQATRPPKGEEYIPLTAEQSDFMEGGFTESPRGTDQPVQKKNIQTLFL